MQTKPRPIANTIKWHKRSPNNGYQIDATTYQARSPKMTHAAKNYFWGVKLILNGACIKKKEIRGMEGK